MKLNTHDRTPKPKDSKFVITMLLICVFLAYTMFVLVAFACFYYAQSLVGGLLCIVIPLLLTAVILILIKDTDKAYVEIKENEFYVVDYYWGIKKEKRISFSNVTSVEILPGYSHRVKGCRWTFFGIRYIVFMKGDKYLFKIICLPETQKVYENYLR